MSDSELSNTLPVSAPAAPKSPELRLESMTPQGIRVTWVAPQQYGDADISVSIEHDTPGHPCDIGGTTAVRDADISVSSNAARGFI